VWDYIYFSPGGFLSSEFALVTSGVGTHVCPETLQGETRGRSFKGAVDVRPTAVTSAPTEARVCVCTPIPQSISSTQHHAIDQEVKSNRRVAAAWQRTGFRTGIWRRSPRTTGERTGEAGPLQTQSYDIGFCVHQRDLPSSTSTGKSSAERLLLVSMAILLYYSRDAMHLQINTLEGYCPRRH